MSHFFTVFMEFCVEQEESVRAKAALEGHDKTKRQLQAHLKFRTVPEIEEAIRKMEIRQVGDALC